MSLSRAINWLSVSRALGGQADPTANLVFKSDGTGGGSMVTNLQVIPRKLTVGLSGDVDYTSIAAAVTAAISGGASGSSPWEISVCPGTYTEPPITIQAGVTLHATTTRLDTVYVVASNPNDDLFTFTTGGSVSGLSCSGVTDPTKCIFRVPNPNTLAVLHGVSVRACSNGIIVSGGAQAVLTYFTVNITGPAEEVGIAIQVNGAGSYAGIVSCFFSVPAVLLPFYLINPIQTCVSVDGAGQVYIVGSSFRVAPKNATADVIRADDGADVSVLSSAILNSGNAFHIGAAGAGTVVTLGAVILDNNLLNFFGESSTGVFFVGSATVDAAATSLVAGADLLGMVQYKDSLSASITGDEWKYAYDSGKEIAFSRFFDDALSTGIGVGGAVTGAAGLTVDVASGDGWIVRPVPDSDAFSVQWAASLGLVLAANSTSYVCYDSSTSTILAQLAPPSSLQILLATAVTDGAGLRFLHDTRFFYAQSAVRVQNFLLSAHQITADSGMATSAGSSGLKFGVGSGSYYRALTLLSYAGSGLDATFSYFYGTDGATEVPAQTQLSNTSYDNAGVLTAMTAGFYRTDTVYITSDGNVSVIYGTAEYATQIAAEAAPLGNPPTFIQPTAYVTSQIVVQEAGVIASILDRRPYLASSASAGGTSVHGALSGLSADDHTQYLLVTGARAMSGPLAMGGNPISGTSTYNGVTVEAHASRHAPGGVDALATAAPLAVLVGAVPAEGAASTYARSDHQHGIAAGVPVTVSTANAAGTASSVARSDHVHGHGAQTDPTLHAVATPIADGFLSSVDKTKLDGIAPGATNTALSNTAPVDVAKTVAGAGVAVEASRQDHQHSILTAAPSSLSVGNASSEGGGADLARATHQHAVPRGTPVSVGTGNSAGVGVAFAADDHVHSGLTRGANDFSLFPVKPVLADADVLLIEDSAAGGDKKQIAASTVVALALAVIAPVNVTKSAAVVGVAVKAARADHKHDITTAVAGSSTPGNAAAEGAATSLARSDHQHALPAFGVAAGTFCQGNDARLANDRTASGLRTATTVVATAAAAAPVAGQVLTAVSDVLATWQTPLATSSGEIIGSTSVSTNSLVDVLMPGMSLAALPAGTYLVWFSGNWSHNVNARNSTMSIYVAGVQQLGSLRYTSSASATSNRSGFCSVARVTVDGAQTIEGRWSTSGASATNTSRSIAYLRVA